MEQRMKCTRTPCFLRSVDSSRLALASFLARCMVPKDVPASAASMLQASSAGATTGMIDYGCSCTANEMNERIISRIVYTPEEEMKKVSRCTCQPGNEQQLIAKTMHANKKPAPAQTKKKPKTLSGENARRFPHPRKECHE